MGKIVMLKYIYSRKFEKGEYSNDPAADEDRFRTISRIFDDGQEYIEAKPAKLEDISRAHSERHFESIKRDKYLYRMALLAAGGAIQAAELAFEKIPSFAVIRPPGHHASRMSAWGFCFFNNMAIALLKLKNDGKINSAFILDFDLHVGDGNINILSEYDNMNIFNPDGATNVEYIAQIQQKFDSMSNKPHDIFAVSAGFDQGIHDWGKLLTPEDYTKIGKMCKKFSKQNCNDRRFAILEGGYNHDEIGTNMLAFCKGFE